MRPVRSVASVIAFVSKEILEVVRSPAAILSLTLGPVLIMLLFALGFSGYAPDLRTVIVVPPESGLPTTVADYADAAPGVEVVDVVEELAPAQALLEARAIDVVVVAPVSLQEQFAQGKQSVIDVMINVSDPIANANAIVVTRALSAELNRRLLEAVARRGIEAVKAANPDVADIPPEVIAAPTTTKLKNVAPVEPSVLAFYGAAVLAFILQHVAVSLIALSLVRERTRGSFELFRFSPVSAAEVVIGKVLACALISTLVAAVTTLLLTRVLGVPVLGNPALLVITVALVVAAALGLGVIIAVFSDTERQVVQLALLVLLASAFFSGLFLKADLFRPLARPFTYLLPATHGIALTQDVMLYGSTNAPWHFAALAIMALTLLIGGSLMLRRQLERA